MSDKIYFRAKNITRDKQRHYNNKSIKPLKRHNNPKCAQNNRVSEYMKQKLVKLRGRIEKSTIKVGDFNILSSAFDRIIKAKIIKDMGELIDPSTNRI